jgi:integrase
MPRLLKGMFRRGNRYYTRLRSEGKDRWISLGPDYSAAKGQLLKVQRGHQSRGTCPDSRTISDVAREWLETYVSAARTPYGQKQAEGRIRLYLDEFLGPKLLGKVGINDLWGYRRWLETRDISKQSVRHMLGDARCVLRWCEESGYIDRAPIPRRLLPKLQERPPDQLTDAEVEAVSRIPDPYGFVVRFALGTGLRWGELTRAQRSHLEHGVLIVSHTKSYKLRRVPLPPGILEEIRGRVGRLVPFSSSGQFNTRVRILSGIWRFHVHQCRHTFACRWADKDGNLVALQQLLGHSSIVTTQRYARLSDGMVKAEVERLASR